MARTYPSPPAAEEVTLHPDRLHCEHCSAPLQARYTNHRTVIHLDRVVRYFIPVRCCPNPDCPRYRRPVHPEAELRITLPQMETGLDLVAEVGSLRYQALLTVPEMHRRLRGIGVPIAERTVTNLLERYEELLCLSLTGRPELLARLRAQGKAILSLDGLQPQVGHEVLWIIREVISGEVLLARSLLSEIASDLVGLLREVAAWLPVPVAGVVSDGQHSIRTAVAAVFGPEVPHQLCQFHFLREAARPIHEADRHARKELTKRLRGVRPIERKAATLPAGPERDLLEGYCAAVRGALTDRASRPPLSAPGVKMQRRLRAIGASLSQIEKKGGSSPRRSPD
jgi:hypothetical protein